MDVWVQHVSKERNLVAQINALSDEIAQIATRVAPKYAKICAAGHPFVPHSTSVLPLLRPALDCGDFQAAIDMLAAYVTIQHLREKQLHAWQHDPEAYATVVQPEDTPYMSQGEDDDPATVASVLRLSPEVAAKLWPPE